MLVEQELLSLPQLIEKLTAAPAAILKLNKGSLGIGCDADICIFNPGAEWQLNSDNCVSAGHNSPFMNIPLKGKVTHTFMKGEMVYQA
jgi:dihydroorotase